MSSEWQDVSVEELADSHPHALSTGPFGSAISAKYFVDYGVPVIRGSNLSTDVAVRLVDEGLVYLSAAKASEFQRSVARRGDLVFTCWGTINQVGLIDERATYDWYIISNKQMKLTVDRTKVDSMFLYYLFSGPEKQAEILDNGIGSSVPGFNLGQLKRHRIFLPPLPEQKRIVGLLGTLDERITLLRETNATLEAIAQALFKSWFVDFDPVRAKQKGLAPEGMDEATAALFPDEFEDSVLGQIPKGWTIKQVGGVCSLQKGCSYKGDGLAEDEGAYMFNLGCFNAPRVFATEKVKRYRGEYKERHAVVPGDLIIANTDMTQERAILGRPLLVPEGYSPGFISHHVFKASGKEIDWPSVRTYLYFSFLQKDFRERAVGYATGTTVLALPKDALEHHQLVVPGSSLLEKFNDVVTSVFSTISNNLSRAKALGELRDNLLPRLISGQLRLPDDRQAEPETILEEVA